MRPRLATTFALIVFGACGFAQTPVVNPSRVYNSASFAGQPVAPGSIVSIFGTNLASSLATAGTIPLSTSLADVSVIVNNLPAPLFFVAPDPVNGDQINFQMPWEAQQVIPPGTNGTVQIVVSNRGIRSAPVNVLVNSAAPGIFAVRVGPQGNYITDGTGQAIAYGNLDGIIAAPPNSLPGLTTQPAKINDPNTLVILATGLGAVDIPVKSGNNSKDQVRRTVITPDVLVGNVPAQVVFSGLSPEFVGVYQLNIVIAPGTPTGNAIPVQIRMNGITTTNQVTIAVSN